jgi:hypothetical protein
VIGVLNWALEHWFLIFLLGVLGVFTAIRDFFVGAYKEIAGARHKRRMKELRARERIARASAKAEDAALPQPGPCVHRRVAPVVSDEVVVAWLCKNEHCGAQLPADWAVRKEDL